MNVFVASAVVVLIFATFENVVGQDLNDEQKYPQGYSACGLCHYFLNTCVTYGFKDWKERRETAKFMRCMDPVLHQWRRNVTTNVDLKFEGFGKGRLAKQGEYDRVSCFLYYIQAIKTADGKTPPTVCIDCAIDHTSNVAVLYSQSDICNADSAGTRASAGNSRGASDNSVPLPAGSIPTRLNARRNRGRFNGRFQNSRRTLRNRRA